MSRSALFPQKWRFSISDILLELFFFSGFIVLVPWGWISGTAQECFWPIDLVGWAGQALSWFLFHIIQNFVLNYEVPNGWPSRTRLHALTHALLRVIEHAQVSVLVPTYISHRCTVRYFLQPKNKGIATEVMQDTIF